MTSPLRMQTYVRWSYVVFRVLSIAHLGVGFASRQILRQNSRQDGGPSRRAYRAYREANVSRRSVAQEQTQATLHRQGEEPKRG